MLTTRYIVLAACLQISLSVLGETAVGRNLIENASFEAGPAGHGWGIAQGGDPLRAAWNSYFDDSTAAHGKFSLRIPATRRAFNTALARNRFHVETKFYPLKEGVMYTLSLFLKADRPMTVEFGLQGHPLDKKAGAEVRSLLWKKAQLTNEWKRISVSGKLQGSKDGLPQDKWATAAVLGGLYKFSVLHDSDAPEPGTVWLDAVQLEEGELTEFAPRRPLEIGFACPAPGQIYFEDEPASLDLVVYANGAQEPASAPFEITDFRDRVVAKGVLPLTGSAAARTKSPISLYNKARGIFRVVATVAGDARPVELVYSVLPRPKHLNEKHEEGLLGTDTHFIKEQLEILKRANFSWVISKFYGRMEIVENEKDKFRFNDVEIDAAHAAGMCILLQILLPMDGPPWALPNLPEGTGRTKSKNLEWDPAKKEACLKDVAHFTEELVNHYKGRVKYYELTNEPYFTFTPEQIGEIVQAMYQAAKRADPACICVVNTDYRIYTLPGGELNPQRPSYAVQMVEKIGWNSMDIVSGHFYNNEKAWFEPWGQWLEKNRKPAWNTETGITPQHFYRYLPTAEGVENPDGYWKAHLAEVQQHADTMLKNFLLTVSAGRMSKYFNYFSRFTNTSPSQPTRRAGRGKENVEYDGGLRPGAVAQAIASQFLEGCRYAGPWQGDARLECHLFSQGGNTRGFFWSSSGKPLILNLPRSKVGFNVLDMLGNPVELKLGESEIEGRAAQWVKFFETALSPAETRTLLSHMRVQEDAAALGEKAGGTGDFEEH